LERVARVPVPRMRLAMPALASHLADAALDRDPALLQHRTTLDAGLQARLEQVARDGARRTGPRVSVALIAADAKSGEILARIGSSDRLDDSRFGWIDMTNALRSPGSTLKPFIFGLAIEEGLVLPETMVSDRPEDFAGYKPANFDMTYQGDVTIREALQKSLNVPTIRLLDALGPSRLVSRLRRAGVTPVFPQGERAGLSLGLGGAGLTLVDLVQLYANLAGGNPDPVALGDNVTRKPGPLGGTPMLSPVAAWHVGDILSGIPNPAGTRPARIAWKTGTSYGYRDAWAIGYDGKHVIGVWVGRADNAAVPGITGANTAGPILFEAFDRSGFDSQPLPKAPAGAVRIAQGDLPAPLVRFGSRQEQLAAGPLSPSQALHITFPVSGSQLELSQGEAVPVILKLQGGTPPFRLLANGRPSGIVSRTRQLQWQPEGAGFSRLTVLDGAGRAQSVEIELR
jgi:penicillin-binding protein 1C